MGRGGRGSNALLSYRRKAWLGRQDSNLGSRDQNPLPYRLATPQVDRLLPQAAAARKRAAAPSSTRPIDPVCLSLRAGIFSAARMRAWKATHRENTRCRTSGSDGRTRGPSRRESPLCPSAGIHAVPPAIQARPRCGVPGVRHGTWPIQPARPGADSCSLSGLQERHANIRPATLSAVRRSAFRPPCRPSADWISGGFW